MTQRGKLITKSREVYTQNSGTSSQQHLGGNQVSLLLDLMLLNTKGCFWNMHGDPCHLSLLSPSCFPLHSPSVQKTLYNYKF